LGLPPISSTAQADRVVVAEVAVAEVAVVGAEILA